MNEKEEKAIKRLQTASEMSLMYYKKPLVITYSGGKDSAVLLDLAERSGILFEVIHSHTTADAPETVYHIRNEFRRLENQRIECKIDYPMYKGKRVSMWSLIPQKGIPPTRIMRYCCTVLKEHYGKGRFIATGVRWAESAKRKGRGIMEISHSDKRERIQLNSDNDDARRLFETCTLKAKRICNPIIDWSDEDIWNYMQDQKIKRNPLYDMGFDRVGCIGCPMGRTRIRLREFYYWPKYKEHYLKAFGRMMEENKRKKLQTSWRDAEEVYHWWIEDGVLPGQIEMELEEFEEDRPD